MRVCVYGGMATAAAAVGVPAVVVIALDAPTVIRSFLKNTKYTMRKKNVKK